MSRTELSLSDEWETPKDLFDSLCDKYNIHPKMDVAADDWNYKGTLFINKHENALTQDWVVGDGEKLYLIDVWCNPPHSKTKQFVLKAHEQWKKYNINIRMLVPLQTLGRKYFNDIFDNYITPKNGGVEWHRVQPRPTFIHPDQDKQ